MEQAAAVTTGCAAVQEEHLPGARARRVEDEPSGLHGSMQDRSKQKLGDSLPELLLNREWMKTNSIYMASTYVQKLAS
jgi:hypothetical protein